MCVNPHMRASLTLDRSHGSADLFGSVGQVGRGDQLRDRRLFEHCPGLVDVGAFEPHDDGNLKADLLGRVDEGVGDDVALGDAAEDVDENSLHFFRRSG